MAKSRSRKKPFLNELSLEDKVKKYFSKEEFEELKKLSIKFEKNRKKESVRVEILEKTTLINGDCLDGLKKIKDNSIDLIFADPPFNLDKKYASNNSDSLDPSTYWTWTKHWIDLCLKKLKPGGSFFVYNIPQWAIPTADYLSNHLTFRSWISIDLTLSMPIKNKLYPAHYSLLYFSKGVPNAFNLPRIAIETCKKCGAAQKDYGGHKSKLNPEGISVKDIWYDIPPVRHKKNKTRTANELSLKLLDRVISMASKKGDIILDPFAGSGTTLVVSKILEREAIGIELGEIKTIKHRLKNIEKEKELLEKQKDNVNKLFTEKALEKREENKISNKGFPIEGKKK